MVIYFALYIFVGNYNNCIAFGCNSQIQETFSLLLWTILLVSPSWTIATLTRVKLRIFSTWMATLKNEGGHTKDLDWMEQWSARLWWQPTQTVDFPPSPADPRHRQAGCWIERRRTGCFRLEVFTSSFCHYSNQTTKYTEVIIGRTG